MNLKTTLILGIIFVASCDSEISFAGNNNRSRTQIFGSTDQNPCNCTITTKHIGRNELETISYEFGKVISRVIHIEKNVTIAAKREEEMQKILSKVNETGTKNSGEVKSCSDSILSLKAQVLELRNELKALKNDVVTSTQSPVDVGGLIKQKVQQFFGQH